MRPSHTWRTTAINPFHSRKALHERLRHALPCSLHPRVAQRSSFALGAQQQSSLPTPNNKHAALLSASTTIPAQLFAKQFFLQPTLTMAQSDIRDMCGARGPTATTSLLLDPFPDPFPSKSMSGPEGAVLVTRQLLAYTPDILRNSHAGQQDSEKAAQERAVIAQRDAQNPLLRYAWLDWSGEYDDDVIRASQAELLDRLQRIAPTLSFWDIMESPMMRATFWSRSPYQLCHPISFYRKHKQAGPCEWQILQKDTNKVAEASLVQYDGNGDLGAVIANKSGLFHLFDEQRNKTGEQLVHPGDMFVIRVLYAPTAENPPGWKQLRVIDVPVVQAPKAVPGMDVGDIPEEIDTVYVSKTYTLIASVRLRASPEEQDAGRVYSNLCTHIDHPAGSQASFTDHSWRLGQPGHQYALYYVRCSFGQPLSSTPEAIFVSEEKLQLIGEFEKVAQLAHKERVTMQQQEQTSAGRGTKRRWENEGEEQSDKRTYKPMWQK